MESQGLIEDLEQSIKVNSRLLHDIVFARASESMNYSAETDQGIVVPAKALELLFVQKQQLQRAIDSVRSESAHAVSTIDSEIQNISESKLRKKTQLKTLKQELEMYKGNSHDKEQTVQGFESYALKLENEIEELENSEQKEPSVLLEDSNKLLRKTRKQCAKAETHKTHTTQRCRELETEIKQFASTIKASGAQVPLCTDSILHQGTLADLNYGNYWYGKPPSSQDSHSGSSELSFNFIQADEDFSFLSQNNEQVISQRAQLRKLELAYSIKLEEMKSIQRVVRTLENYNELLEKAIERKLSKVKQ